MRSFKSLIKLGLILPLLPLQTVFADVIIWASDNRSGQPVRAEQAEWLRYLQAQSQATNPLITPTKAGVAQDYPLHLQAQPDVGALMTSRLATGSDAALWVQLNANGLEWVLEQAGQAQKLRTPATSDGLTLGLNWMGMQLSMQPAAEPVFAQPNTGVVATDSVAATQVPAAPVAPVAPAPVAANQPTGTAVEVSGVFDAPDFLRLTQGLRALEGVHSVYLASISGTDVGLIVDSQTLAPTQLQALLAEQPWLRRTEQGGLRWDALALPLPGAAPMGSQAVMPETAVPAVVTPVPETALPAAE